MKLWILIVSILGFHTSFSRSLIKFDFRLM